MSEPAPSPLYWRVLRLQRVRPGGVLRVLLVEGLAAVGLLLALGAGVTAWSILVLPAVGAVVVKAHDILARWL